MSRSVELLNDVLRDESAVPSSTEILANLPGRIRRHRRRVRAAWSAGAAVMAIFVTASVMVGLRLPHVSPALGPLHAPSVVEVSRLDATVTVSELTPGHVTAHVSAAGVSTALFASAPGATPADQLAVWRARGKAVTVNGSEGFYVVGSEYTASPAGVVGNTSQTLVAPTLGWQYAPNSWAFLTGCEQPQQGSSDVWRGCRDPEKALLRAARIVKFGSHATITAPVQFGYLPNEWHLDTFDRLGTDCSGVLNIGPHGPYQISLTFAGGGVNPPMVTITPKTADWPAGWDLLFRPTDTINGHPVFWQGDGPESSRTFAWVDFGTCRVQVISGDHDVTTRIVSSLKVANCFDMATWWNVGKINASDDLPPHPEMPISLATR